MRDPRYDILFEPVRIGPVVARNRFYQVPHCNGMGYRDPNALAEMRGVKAEGGWAVVCTEETEIHPTGDITPYVELRNWSDEDMPSLALIAEKVHRHGALAGIQLVHGGVATPNLTSREAPIGPGHVPVAGHAPIQARRMDKADIAEFRRWHLGAVDRSLVAGFDIVYVYAGHGLTLLQHFLSPRYNDRTDEYGGSVANRARLLREVLEDTREAAEGRAAVACRICIDEIDEHGITRSQIEEVVGLLGELPDLWDFQLGYWEDDSVTARFGPEGAQEPYVRGLKGLTTKPVVGVGRFTSPDEMVRQIRSGVLDLIGAARPSIADPFLPSKIEEGRIDEIRECIGCNICVSGDWTMSPIRCTQNASMGEEWRRGWHPERHRPAAASRRVLVVGAGPAGLEAAATLGKKGHRVVLVEGSRDLGGRVAREARLPGLASWNRVVDYRRDQLGRLSNVEHYFESTMTAAEALSYDFDHICIATGSTWRRDGVGRRHPRALPVDAGAEVLTPDDLMAGRRPRGERVILFDDDHFYIGGVLAELLAKQGHQVTLVTPAAMVSEWTRFTMEQPRIHRRLAELGVVLRCNEAVTAVTGTGVETADEYTGGTGEIAGDSVVMVTARLPDDDLARELEERRGEWRGLRSARVIGDCLAPGTIAHAVWSGRRYAEELEEPNRADGMPYRRNLARVESE